MNIASLTLSVFEPFGEVPSPALPSILIGGVGMAGQVPANYAFRRQDDQVTQRRRLVNRLDAATETKCEVKI